MNIYVKRLFEEWKKHGKIIIAVDFDDTICMWNPHFNKPDIERVIKLIKQAYLTGAYIVIFTASDIDRYPEIQKYCDELQIPISAINTNPIDLPYGKNGKIYANIFLDDRAGLIESCNILEEALYQVRSYQQTTKHLDDVA